MMEDEIDGGVGVVVVLAPSPTMYEELAKPGQLEAGAKLYAGEIGAVDCGITFVGGRDGL